MNPLTPQLVLGPLLRYVGTTTATVWVETDAPRVVEVLGHERDTFHVEGHHYALVLIEDLEPGRSHPYEVRLDGASGLAAAGRAARSGDPHARGRAQARLVFGSCRVGAPAAAAVHPRRRPIIPRGSASTRSGPTRGSCRTARERGRTACCCSATRSTPTRCRPRRRAFIRSRRDVREPPGEEIADFEEYTRLYRESWSDPDIRWLLSTVPSTMIFDDHDVSDDWNISQAWVDEMRALPWWDERITGAFMAYWLYQHLGNLSPPELAEETLFREVQADDDAGPRLRAFARHVRPRVGGEQVGVLPRLRALAAARDRLARGARSAWTGGATWSTRRSGTGSSSTRAARSTT